MRPRLDLSDDDDPVLSVVNIIDVFLVMMAVMLLMLATSAAVDPHDARAMLSERPGELDPRASFEELQRYETSGLIGQGQGIRAGTAYRLDDGTLIFVPD